MTDCQHAGHHKNNYTDVSQLIHKYFELIPNPNDFFQKVKFGTSGHRGTSENYTFNEAHVLSVTQAIAQQRRQEGILGPCYLGKDTHALSEVAFISVLEVLSANKIHVITQGYDVYTPSPIIAHAILNYNKNRHSQSLKADGIVVTSSHNPPGDGGIKYYSHYGGIADTRITNMIEKYANSLLLNNLRGVYRLTLSQAWRSDYIHLLDFTQEYIKGLVNIINMQCIRESKVKLGIDPMGGTGIDCWSRIAQCYKLDITLINDTIDSTFHFIPPNRDGIIRIDCSSEEIMKNLLKICNKYDLIFANDPDCDRYAIITPQGFINANNYLVIAINFLFKNRPNWNIKLGIGKTLVSSTIINQISKKLNRHLVEKPVGFKWFVKSLFQGMLGFVGEESAGGVFLQFNSAPWSTDKDGIIMCLLAAEIFSSTEKTLQDHYNRLIKDLSFLSYTCIQIPISYSTYAKIFDAFISGKMLHIRELADDRIIKIIQIINNTPTGLIVDGIKFITKNGWVAIRNSGTEKVCKIYCESFLDDKHRKKIENSIYENLACLSIQI
ncbi:alpha-D-glucose phosphate-specific phosphoglucomutase [Blochmannia endosymbiont of Polyrhachis (Hedomyrma) turneri]|uniref:alpha-D-glucose phosphate-specific phosphoglucomutase n=1 Tax=Blochmannia endosymbiont of Polyrhachis (Hedomyrma) turneri TaxID=1505596 RepID=UPI00061A8B01|nr:alpha-D-glucose phosphate-specific phosphoglucomutase [Blochmannia endosymbiont of Polyrhachis (Hedomyrma) turneri]AKC59894.1 phosphoglucomutase [Blochmannia endosymbiont of Polyrhachis (Hedomyrma) turneri]